MSLRFYFIFFVCFLLGIRREVNFVICLQTLNGRYSREIQEYSLLVPYKLHPHGHFSTFKIPSFFEQHFHQEKRKKRSLNDPDLVRYGMNFNGNKFGILLWPSHQLVSPDAFSEKRRPKLDVGKRKLKKLDRRMCHYSGYVDGDENSKVALSTCDGLAGYVTINNKRYFIEPLEEHVANEKGQHLHVIYQRNSREEEFLADQCGTSGNWENAWRERFLEKFTNEMKGSLNDRIDRSSESIHRYLEVMVVCDKTFLEHHKNIDVETYVLTIMNMVSDFYHDHTSGNMMDVVVVRILYLDKEEEEIDLVINPHAENTLASFCKWQEKINPKETSNPNHHDIAVLLTRHDICADEMANCGLRGLAYVATACDQKQCCAINEDKGLTLGIVVAHEMGHVMGCAHDKEGESTCEAQDPKDKSFYVMAPAVHLYTTRWSPCSRGFITALFENGLGECLNDEPEVSLYKSKEVLPGVIYGAEEQCRLLQPNATVCEFGMEDVCEVLMCQSEPTSCFSRDEPAADGTKCGENKWCYKKKCVEMGQRPAAINGGWGNWGSFTECSRTCGGGVKLATRECDNPIPEHGGRYCLGERKRVIICNVQPCPPASPGFRDVQCAEYNTKPFERKLHQWKAHFKSDEPCILYCISEENVYTKMAPRVKDGTKCKAGTKHICISGVCRKVGCDYILDSDAVEDICGICNGDGTKCNIVDQVFRSPPQSGYFSVARIPLGSRGLTVEELGPSINGIAISDASGQNFYLNGNNRFQYPGEKLFGSDTMGVYSRDAAGTEKLTIHGPLSEELVFYVIFFRPENVGYHYRYAAPSPDTSYIPKYHWEQTDWEPCTARCGGGEEIAKWDCIEDKGGRVSNSFCEPLGPHENVAQPCNEQACRAKWKIGKWGKCHACKYKSGVRSREVECVRENPHPGADDILVEDPECKERKPGTRELCNSQKKCKSRRFTDGLPDEMMEEVWRQIHFAGSYAGKSKRQEDDTKSCEEDLEVKKLPKLQVGKIIKDRVSPEEIKVIEVPVKQSYVSTNISDEAFEEMGEDQKNSGGLDMEKAKVVTGKQAAKVLNKMEKENQKKKG